MPILTVSDLILLLTAFQHNRIVKWTEHIYKNWRLLMYWQSTSNLCLQPINWCDSSHNKDSKCFRTCFILLVPLSSIMDSFPYFSFRLYTTETRICWRNRHSYYTLQSIKNHETHTTDLHWWHINTKGCYGKFFNHDKIIKRFLNKFSVH